MVLLTHEQEGRLKRVVGKVKHDKAEFGRIFFGKDLRDSPWQSDAVNMGGTISTKVAGRRAGKTLTTTVDVCHECATKPRQTWLMTGPSMDQARLPLNEIEEAAAHPNGMMEALLKGPIKQEDGFPTARLKTGSVMRVRSTARDGIYLRGKGANGIAITEAAFIKDKVWQEVIRPIILDRGGVARLESTPNGDNYFRQLHELAANPEKRVLVDGSGRVWADPSLYYRTIHATVYDNTRLSREEIERIKGEIPEWVWRVEYLAEFLADEESVFSWPLLSELFDEDYPRQFVPLLGHHYAIGVDLAQVNDYTAIIVLDITFWPVTVATWMHYRGKPYTGPDSVVADVNALKKTFNNARVIVDATMETAVAEQIIGAEAFRFTQQSRNVLLSNLQVLAQNRKYQLPPAFVRLRDEMRMLRRVRKGHTVRIDHPTNNFDDTVMALALASWPLRSAESAGDPEAVQALTGAQFYG